MYLEFIKTLSGHEGGKYGKGGDFLYRWGNPQNYDMGNASDQILHNQHGINWIPVNFPGENNFLLFNNVHNGTPMDGESAILEFILPVDSEGNYNINGNYPYGPENYELLYEENIFSPMQGGAFRLPNGNTLITDCDNALILEVTNGGHIVWEYQETGNNVAIARSQKYDVNYFGNDNVLGDINFDGFINILDVVILVNFILGNQIPTESQFSSSDLNSDGILNILDIVQLVNIIL